MSDFHEEEVLGKAYDGRLMQRLVSYLRPYRVVVFLALVAIFFYGILQAVPPYLMKVELDRYLDPSGSQQLPAFLARFLSPNPLVGVMQIALALFLPTVVVTFFLEFAQSFAMQLVGQKVMYDLRKEIFGHLQRLQMSFYDRNPVGRLVTRVTTDVDVLNELFASGLVTILGDILVLVFILAIMFSFSPLLTAIMLTAMPFVILTTVIFRRSVTQSYRRIRVAIARINSYLQEHITGIVVLQLFNRERRACREFEEVNRQHMIAFKDAITAYGWFYPLVEFISMLALA